jgi:hypothetical protein
MLLEIAQKCPERILRTYQTTLPDITDREENLIMDRRMKVASRREARRRASDQERARRNREEQRIRKAEEARQAEAAKKEHERLEAERQEQTRQDATRKDQIEQEQQRGPVNQRLVSAIPDRVEF